MNYLKLKKIKKLYFGVNEITRILNILPDSAKVCCVRLAKKGIIIRIKRGQYALKDKWDVATREEKFIIANIIQTPSYISLLTALDYYEITTQIQQSFVESICVNKTKETNLDQTIFNYTKIKKDLYFGFVKKGEFFIATPEKAFLDAFYLLSIKRYSFDLSSVYLNKLNKSVIDRMIKKYPLYTQKLFKEYGYI